MAPKNLSGRDKKHFFLFIFCLALLFYVFLIGSLYSDLHGSVRYSLGQMGLQVTSLLIYTKNYVPDITQLYIVYFNHFTPRLHGGVL